MASAVGRDKVTDCGGKRKRSDGGVGDDKTGRKRNGVLVFFDDEAYHAAEEEDSSDDSGFDSEDYDDVVDFDSNANNEHGKSPSLPKGVLLQRERCVSAVKMPHINIRTGRLKELKAKAEEAKRKAMCEGSLGSSAALDGRGPSEVLSMKKTEPNGTAQQVNPLIDDFWNQLFHNGSASFDANGVAWSAMMNEMVAVDTDNLETSGLDSHIACAFNCSVQAMMALACARASLDARSSLTSKLEAELDAVKAEVKKFDKCKIEAEETEACLLKSSEILHVHLKKEKSRCAEMKKELDAAKLEMDELKKKYESDMDTREKIITSVRGELNAARRGEGLDLEELADSEAFQPTRRILEQEIARGLVKMIQNKHPELDLSFIYDEEVDAGA